ncbi:unnamed protein product [Leptosia nina]|uniref:THAP-type domain-containing protein n=1 Tax=Leptosia nina TaxID=320188 RepID=A0AAV1JCP3_9NEOP
MGYYCTVPQCTSLAGKTKNVKFHRFPRDDAMAEKWNVILKRMKPITKYSKVCSLHFTQADYNVTAMGQWKTLSKDAVPTQNLPKLNPDGTVMVIRKSRSSVKYRSEKKEDRLSSSEEKMSSAGCQTQREANPSVAVVVDERHISIHTQNSILAYSLQALSPSSPNVAVGDKPKKQDAIMQTDPLTDDESPGDYEHVKYEVYPNDYLKEKEYIPQTAEEYNKEAEKYALERKSSSFEKTIDYQTSGAFDKNVEYQKNEGSEKSYRKQSDFKKSIEYEKSEGFDKSVSYQKMDYDLYYQDSVEMLRNQQQNLQLLQEQHRVNENQNFFDENHIKQEVEFTTEEEKFFDGSKDRVEDSSIYEEQRRLIEHTIQGEVKQEPDTSNNNGHESIMQQQNSTYFAPHQEIAAEAMYSGRPGPELLIAKQNALAAHTQLWQNTMKRPFFYTENSHYNAPPLLHRYEDLSRILQ